MESFIQLLLVFQEKNLSNNRAKIFSQRKIENKHNQWMPHGLDPSSKQRQTVKTENFQVGRRG